MATHNPVGRVNYEPNSWSDRGGPREDPVGGFRSFEEPIEDTKARVRSERFRRSLQPGPQFYVDQTAIEQTHNRRCLRVRVEHGRRIRESTGRPC
jgi:catalase